MLFLYVANGVGTIRSMQGDPRHVALRDRARRGDIIAPTMYLAAPAFRAEPVAPADVALRVAAQLTGRSYAGPICRDLCGGWPAVAGSP